MKKLLAVILSLLIGCSELVAAIPAGAIWEIVAGSTASNANGGFFNPGATFPVTDFTATSATGDSAVISSATYTFVAGDDAAWIYVSAGTNWVAGRFCEIESVAGGSATLNSGIGECVDLANRVYTASATAGVATVASPTGGTLGIDYSRGTSAITTAADLASTDASTVPCAITSATAPFGVNHVGNGIHIYEAGTAFTVSWYHIASVSVVTATLDRACGSGVAANGDFAVGGALSLASTLDDDVLEMGVAGNQWFIKNTGSPTLGESVTLTATGGTQNPIRIAGYNSLRGDNPTAGTRPAWSVATFLITLAANWEISNIILANTAGSTLAVLSLGTGGKLSYSKVSNVSSTANLAAINATNASWFLWAVEAVSTLGRAFVPTASGYVGGGSYFHDSDVGIRIGGNINATIEDSIIETCVTTCIDVTTAVTNYLNLNRLTLYGAGTPAGVGLALVTTTTNVRLTNSIISGFTTGVNHADTQSVGFDACNAYYNNTTNATNWTLGTGSINGTDPLFTNAASGNFAVGATTLTGCPGTFAGALTTGSSTIGAAQRAGGGGGGVLGNQ